jgi:hypothetical protein
MPKSSSRDHDRRVNRSNVPGMRLAPAVEAGEAQAEEGRESADGARRMRPSTVLGTAVLVALARWWTSHRREMFSVTPDEPGQLAFARFVGGMARWNMFDHSTRQPGYGTLIGPVYWFTSDPVVAFRAALVVNAVLGAVACVLLAVLAHRLTAMSPRACVVSAVLVCLSPAVLFATDLVWSESLVAVIYLAALLAMLRFDERPSIGRGVVLSALAAAGYGTHSRLLPLVAVAVGLIVVEAGRRRIAPRRALGLIALAASMTGAVTVYSDWLVYRIWETPSEINTFGEVFGRLAHPAAVVVSTIGQAWYQLVVTAGLAGLGAIALVMSARKPPGDGPHPRPADARIVLAASGSLIALSIVFMSDRLRPDRLVYGRYNDAIVGPIVIAGVGALVTIGGRTLARSLVVVATVMLLAAVILQTWRGEALASGGWVRWMVLGLQAYTGAGSTIEPLSITATALALVAIVAACAFAARRLERPGCAVLVLVPLLAIGYVRTREVMDRGVNSWALSEATVGRLHNALPAGEEVRIRIVPDEQNPVESEGSQILHRMLYQFYLPENPVAPDGPDSASITPFVIAPLADPELTASGAEVVWRDPAALIGLWREDERLDARPPTD